MSWKWKKGVMVRRWLYKKRIAVQALRDIKDDIYLVDSRNLTSEGYLRDGGWGAISPESDWARENSDMGKRVQGFAYISTRTFTCG